MLLFVLRMEPDLSPRNKVLRVAQSADETSSAEAMEEIISGLRKWNSPQKVEQRGQIVRVHWRKREVDPIIWQTRPFAREGPLQLHHRTFPISLFPSAHQSKFTWTRNPPHPDPSYKNWILPLWRFSWEPSTQISTGSTNELGNCTRRKQ